MRKRQVTMIILYAVATIIRPTLCSEIVTGQGTSCYFHAYTESIALRDAAHCLTTIANNAGHDKLCRARAVCRLFLRHTHAMPITDLTRLLSGSKWLQRQQVSLISVLGARPPVATKWLTPNNSVFVLHAFPELGDDSVIIGVAIFGRVTERELFSALRHQKCSPSIARAKLLDVRIFTSRRNAQSVGLASATPLSTERASMIIVPSLFVDLVGKG